MQNVKPLEPGVMFWAERDELAEMKSLGVRCGQLGIPGSMELNASAAAEWKSALDRESFTLVTVFAAYNGESYADIPTVARTVGFVPPETRAERERRTKDLSDFAAALGVGSIACHIGCVPEDAAHPDYSAVREMVRRVCDHAARHGQTFALETGQERAEVMLQFFRDVDRPNLRINFDPANMVLYGTGDPIEALRALAPHVASVHCKDGDWPPKDIPGALGTERPLGEGAVGIERFIGTLKEIGFRGSLNVEREVEDQRQRLRDMRKAVQLLERLRARKTAIAPMLSVRNGARAVDFYKTAFGAAELFRIDSESGAVVARLSVEGAEFWVADESPEHKNFSPESLGGGTVRMVMIVEDPDAAFDRAIAAGAAVVWPVSEQHGWRLGRIADPFGHHWEIGKPLREGA